MLGMTPMDLGFRHRQQSVDKGGEGLILLRRLAHVVSILALLMPLAVASASQARSDQGNQPNNSAPVTREQYESDVRAFLDEFKAIRDDIAKNEQARAQQEESWYFFGDYAPVWSNWFLFAAAVVAGRVAYRAFNHERDAVRLTQRADILLDSIQLHPSNPLAPNTQIQIHFKNFGPTQASKISVDAKCVIPGFIRKEAPPRAEDWDTLPRVTLGAGDTLGPKLTHIDRMYEPDVINKACNGELPFYIETTVRYEDVFGIKPHRTYIKARYLAPTGFVVVESEAD